LLGKMVKQEFPVTQGSPRTFAQPCKHRCDSQTQSSCDAMREQQAMQWHRQCSLPCGPFEGQAEENAIPSQNNARCVPVLLLDEIKSTAAHAQLSSFDPGDDEDGTLAPRTRTAPGPRKKELPPRPQTEGSMRPETHASVLTRVRPGTSLSSAHTLRASRRAQLQAQQPSRISRPGSANCNEEMTAAVHRQHLWDLSPPPAPLSTSSPKPPATMLPTRAVPLGLRSGSDWPRQARSVSMIASTRLDAEGHTTSAGPVRRRDVLSGGSLVELEVLPSRKQFGPLAPWEALTNGSKAASLPRPRSMSAMALDLRIQRMPHGVKPD